MALSLKLHHLPRYREIIRLLRKYGHGDLVRDFELDALAAADPAVASAGSTHPGKERPLVHASPGEVLSRQRAISDREAGVTSPERTGNGIPAEHATNWPEQLADDLEAMGPTYIKVGQFLSTRPDLLPAPYIDALSRLQDHVEPFRFADVKQIVSEELGTRLSKAFASFDPEPVAAASLGQVHRAELRSGRKVAVKVQRPGITERIVADLEVLAGITQFLDQHSKLGKRYGFVDMLEEFRKSLLRELDYKQEARNLVTLADHLDRYDHLVVPAPVKDYVTTRVLTMEFVHGRNVASLGPLTKAEIDGAMLADELCRAYLQQIMVNGFFHADPHPGNVFLMEDGRLAILDLGMVGQIEHTMQEDLLKLVLAVSEGRGEDAGDVIVKLGRPMHGADPVELRRRVSTRVIQFQGLRIKDIALGRLLIDIVHSAAETGHRMPRELTLLCKTLLNVDQVTRRLDPEFDPNASIREHAADIMRQRMLKGLSPGKLFAGLLEMKELAEKLPRRLNQMIDAITQNRVRVKIDAINEALLMEGLQKVANRITLGLVLSSMIVGAALLMRIETSFKILGYPGLAILFFLIAAIGAIWLAMNILFTDMRAARDKIHGLK